MSTHSDAPPGSDTQPIVALVTPNLYQLQGGPIHVTYSTTSIDGQPHFSYQDPHQTLFFKGDDIRVTDTPRRAAVLRAHVEHAVGAEGRLGAAAAGTRPAAGAVLRHHPVARLPRGEPDDPRIEVSGSARRRVGDRAGPRHRRSRRPRRLVRAVHGGAAERCRRHRGPAGGRRSGRPAARGRRRRRRRTRPPGRPAPLGGCRARLRLGAAAPARGIRHAADDASDDHPGD